MVWKCAEQIADIWMEKMKLRGRREGEDHREEKEDMQRVGVTRGC